MDATLLLHAGSRKRGPRPQPFLGDLALARARTHEFCGLARRTLAMMLAGRMEGPVFWIAPAWEAERLNAEAMISFADPSRFVFFAPQRAEDVLWVMEEALRCGQVPLVVADIPAPPGLTPVRRLHLAAETGAAEHGRAPLGLLLTGRGGGAPGVESRWQLEQAYGPGGAGWTLTRLRARTAPPQSWRIAPQQGGFVLAPAEAAA